MQTVSITTNVVSSNSEVYLIHRIVMYFCVYEWLRDPVQFLFLVLLGQLYMIHTFILECICYYVNLTWFTHSYWSVCVIRSTLHDSHTVWMCESCKVDLITPEIGIVQGLVVIHTHKNTLQYKWQASTVYGYFGYIMIVSFIGGGNWSARWKPLTNRKSLTNFITYWCIKYTYSLNILVNL
jgi:hypothetical protein